MSARFVLIVLVCSAGSAAAAIDLPAAYTEIARRADVPPLALYAIACAESGRSTGSEATTPPRPWPWTLNIGGAGRFFASRQAAQQALDEALKETRVVDIGLGQVNWRWHQERFAHPGAALDPYRNLAAAAHILREQFELSGDWYRAVGRYHTPAATQSAQMRRRHYLRRVLACVDGS